MIQKIWKMKLSQFLVKLIDLYQKYISKHYSRPICIFYPSCSEYIKEAILKYGSLKGIFLGFKRILKCHPWNIPKIDKLK